MPKILVVDDAAFMRVTLRNVLEVVGYEVAEASNGFEAVEQYESFRPDLVTMDILMPERDGILATRDIVALDPDARIIVVTAVGNEVMVREAIEAGAVDFIVKPFQPARVQEAVRRGLGERGDDAAA